jgi:hypothetical protein
MRAQAAWAASRDDHAAMGAGVLPALHRQLRGADQTQGLSQIVEYLHRRRGVVDGGRQREIGNVDEDPDRERGILLDRALVTQRHHLGEAVLGARPRGLTPYTSISRAPNGTKSPMA